MKVPEGMVLIKYIMKIKVKNIVRFTDKLYLIKYHFKSVFNEKITKIKTKKYLV